MATNHGTGDLVDFFNTQGISPLKVKYYIGWLNQFFQFYNSGIEDISNEDVIAFGNFLSKNGMEEWQIIQAREAVLLYIEKFLKKKICFPGQAKRIRSWDIFKHGRKPKKHS